MPCGTKKYMSGGKVKEIARKEVKDHEATMHKAKGGMVKTRGTGAATKGSMHRRSVV